MDNFIARSNDTMVCKTNKCQGGGGRLMSYDITTRGLGGVCTGCHTINMSNKFCMGIKAVRNSTFMKTIQMLHPRSMLKRIQNIPDEEIGSWKLLFPPPDRELLQFLQLVSPRASIIIVIKGRAKDIMQKKLIPIILYSYSVTHIYVVIIITDAMHRPLQSRLFCEGKE